MCKRRIYVTLFVKCVGMEDNMTVEDFKKKDVIYFEKIQTGLSDYNHVSLKLTEKAAAKHFRELMEKYGTENAYTDFYYFRLDEDAREEVESELTVMDIDYLREIQPEDVEDEIIFPLTEPLLQIIVKLNASEMLFSTLYFQGSKEKGLTPSSWWGNYEQEYICFRRSRT